MKREGKRETKWRIKTRVGGEGWRVKGVSREEGR
jgi:hypothetical protein